MNYLGSYQLLQMPQTLDIVSKCWKLAEDGLQKDIKQNFPDKEEEFITQAFHGKFADWLKIASEERFIEQAFFEDLRTSFTDISDHELSQIARGLIADVKLHNRSTETITGGDLGLMLIRPLLIYSDHFIRIQDYRRGILCQAKLKDRLGRWGRFTQNQKKVLPERLPYSCLLLYHYSDTERRQFCNFQWYACNAGDTMAQLNAYLKNDNFPYLVESDLIIEAIGNDLIGTDDDEILDQVISPAKNPTLTISITWPPGGHPRSMVYVYATNQQHTYYEQRNAQMYQGY